MILVVDGNNLAFASNMSHRLHTKDGFPTQAIVGFFNSLHSYTKKFNPQKIFVAWDGGRSKKRMEICPEYKANRDMKEKTQAEKNSFEEFKLQMPLIKKALFYMGVYNCVGGGVEGDDLVGMLALTAQKAGDTAVICSADQDFYQLISANISVYSVTNFGKHGERMMNIHTLPKKFGLLPSQWLEYKAILGDKSDNIGGVPNVGKVTATKFLQKFGSIEELKADQDSEKPAKLGKREKAVLANLELIARNIKMMDLFHPAGDFTKVKLLRQAPDYKSLRAFFKKYEMKEIYLEFNNWISTFNTVRMEDDI